MKSVQETKQNRKEQTKSMVFMYSFRFYEWKLATPASINSLLSWRTTEQREIQRLKTVWRHNNMTVDFNDYFWVSSDLI